MVGAVGKSHEVEQFEGAFLRLRRAFATDVGGYHDILEGGELRQQLVELEDEADVLVAEVAQLVRREAHHVDAVNADSTTIGFVECTHYLQQCCLAGTARADNAHYFSFVYMQVDALEHLQRAEALGYSFYVDHMMLRCCYGEVLRLVFQLKIQNFFLIHFPIASYAL